MAVYKEEKTNTWRVLYRYTDSVEFARKEFYNILWVEKWGITTEHCELNNIKKLQQKSNELQAMGIIDVIDEIL